ncbi:MAG: DUF998 domain-containing protein [Promethearchaeota archaeon]
MIKARDFFSGKISKQIMIHYYMPIHVGTILLCLFIAYLCYPPQYHYNWTNSMISRLGWPDENPLGLIFFSIGTFIYGMLYIPTTCYIYRRMALINRCVARIIFILLFLVGIGWMGIGLIPNYPIPITMAIHGINAILIFAGMAFGGLLIMVLIWADYLKNKEDSTYKSHSLIAYSIIYLYMLVMIIILLILMPKGLSGHYLGDTSIPPYLSPTTYEWLSFFGMLGLITSLYIILPGI